MGGVPSEARRAIGYVPQFATFRRDFPISVEGTEADQRARHHCLSVA